MAGARAHSNDRRSGRCRRRHTLLSARETCGFITRLGTQALAQPNPLPAGRQAGLGWGCTAGQVGSSPRADAARHGEACASSPVQPQVEDLCLAPTLGRKVCH